MLTIDDPGVRAAETAIEAGDVAMLRVILTDRPELATARVGTDERNRTLLHVAVDWPGHRPRTAEVIRALLDAGADIEATGAVIGGGTPLTDATAFGQWAAARRLVERGAVAGRFEAAAMGLLDRLRELYPEAEPEQSALDGSLWGACHGGRLEAVQYLVGRGADPAWPGWDDLTPLGAARRSAGQGLPGAAEVVAWLESRTTAET